MIAGELRRASILFREPARMAKRTPKPEYRIRMPKAPAEMWQWSELMEAEAIEWKGVSSRSMFGMTALYRGKKIFAALPRTRAIGSPYSIAFKLPRGSAETETDARVTIDHPGGRWATFELGSGRDISDALAWLRKAYNQAR
jgi:hypothetical protein